MVDNFDILSSWFDNLTDQGDFFFVQVIQRKNVILEVTIM